MYQFPEDLKRAYESSALSFVYYEYVDGQAVPVLVSDGFCQNTGVSRGIVIDWLSAGLFGRMHPNDVGIVSKISDDFLNKRGKYDIIFRCYIDSPEKIANQKEKDYVHIHGYGKWQTMPDGKELAVITYSNLSKTQDVYKKELNSYLVNQIDRFYIDPLTNLPNLNYLHEFGKEKFESIRVDGRVPQVVYTDVYSMQSYNNQYGFKAGNDLLCLVANTLKQLFPLALITRGHDDHFIMITGVDDNKELEARLLKVNAIIRNNAYGNTAGIRSGICPVKEGEILEKVLDQAKHTLKRIENDLNKEVAFFSQEADDIYWRNRYILENFDRAMENGWIKVFYHALFRIETQKITAFEGLARWVDPNRGIISPGEFIPVLQKYHQLYKLDLYMFERVCKEVIERHDNGLPLAPVSINFSRQDFDHVDVVGEMDRLFEKYDLANYVDKNYFIVEITEQDIAVGTDVFLNQLKKIRNQGYRLWLDDFGSGYSAINMFSRYEFDLIKYDMDLIRHLNDNGGVNRLILKELVYVSKKLGIHTLAEGVETEEQFEFLKSIGCELAQGFLLHKPESLDEILFRIKNGARSPKICETEGERETLNNKWFE